MNRDTEPSTPSNATNPTKSRLKQIEWMLAESDAGGGIAQSDEHDQGYGDLTELKEDGLILRWR